MSSDSSDTERVEVSVGEEGKTVKVRRVRYQSAWRPFEPRYEWRKRVRRIDKKFTAECVPRIHYDLEQYESDLLWRAERYKNIHTFPRDDYEMWVVEEGRRYLAEDYPFEKEYWEWIRYEQQYLLLVNDWNRYGEQFAVNPFL